MNIESRCVDHGDPDNVDRRGDCAEPGEFTTCRAMIARRFGHMPPWLDRHFPDLILPNVLRLAAAEQHGQTIKRT